MSQDREKRRLAGDGDDDEDDDNEEEGVMDGQNDVDRRV